MKYKHLNRHDRNQIEILITRGYSQTEIAKVLGVHRSTISRELRRIKGREKYSAGHAEHNAYVRRLRSKYQGMKIEQDNLLRQKIITALKSYQSPQAIAVRFGDISHVGIYRWLYSSWGQRYCKYLCTRRYKPRKQRKNGKKREMIKNAVSVHERPLEGVHLEGDLFVSSHNTVSVAVLVEPKSQYMWAVKIPNRKPSTMVKYVNEILRNIRIDSITWDRGIENQHHQQFGTTSYFCDPHSPWQKPHVENNIGLLRKWFVPKRTNLDCMKQTDLDRYVCIVNEKWRVSRNGRSARELIMESGILQGKLHFTI